MRFTSGDPLADKRHSRGEEYRDAGDHAAAEEMFEQALELLPDWPVALMSLARTRIARDNAAAAAGPLQRVLELDPSDGWGARGLLARVTGQDDGQVLSPAYVAGLFDSYADRFDAHLTGALQYDAPLQMRMALDRVRAGRIDRVMDLGCGTGLLGSVLVDVAGELVGVDLSAGMVALAQKKQVYDRLIVGEIVAALRDEPADAFDLVAAADVFVYFGDLEPVFAAARRALRAGGHFAFTVQDGGDAAWQLGPDMRYAHGRAYLRQLAEGHGLEPLILEATSTRIDRGVPVPGLLAVLRRPADVTG
jgi:predicted TPR repeat methyltransferase